MTPFNVLNNNMFADAMEMSAAIDKLTYTPSYLSTLGGLIVPDPVRTEVIWIEERNSIAVILPFSPRGAPPHQTGGDKRLARAFNTLRFADASRITAAELLGVRAWASDVALKDAATEIARRQTKMLNNVQLTKEYHLLNLVTQAKVLDADGSLVYDWAAEFEQTFPVEVSFDLANQAGLPGAILKKCRAARRSIQIGLAGVGTANRIVCLCGDAFYEDLTTNPEVRNTFLNWQAAADLRNSAKEWSSFVYGDIEFINYRSSDPGTPVGSIVSIGTDKGFFFPLGAGIFRYALSPGERFEHLGQVGQEFYSAMVLDDDRNSWADVEMYSYPLPVCTMPQALYRARRT